MMACLYLGRRPASSCLPNRSACSPLAGNGLSVLNARAMRYRSTRLVNQERCVNLCSARVRTAAAVESFPRDGAPLNPILANNAGSDYKALKGAHVISVSSGDSVELLSLWQAWPGTKVVLAFMTHFADLSSWEYVQKLGRVLPTLEASGAQVFAVGLGSRQNAQEFARIHKFPASRLYADEDGACYQALGFSSGFRPEQLRGVSPYARLIPMLMGVGSPGTLQEVARGYMGDRDSKPVWDSPTPFDVLGSGYQRPFELATLRLFNMVGILPKWSVLCPPDTELLTQQGGTLALDGQQTTFRHNDKGILDYCDVDDLLRAVPFAPPPAAVTDDWQLYKRMRPPLSAGADAIRAFRRQFVRHLKQRDVDWRDSFYLGVAEHAKQLKKRQAKADEASRQAAWREFKEQLFAEAAAARGKQAVVAGRGMPTGVAATKKVQ